MATSVIESGNYELFIDTGFLLDAFVLDDATRGVLDGTQYVLDGTTEFAPMLEYSTNVNIKRGRRDVGDQFSAGTMSFNLNDDLAGGTLNPLYSSSPYVDPAGQFTLAPLRRVSFGRYNSLGTFITLFVGQIVNYDYTYELGGQNTVNVYCADDFYLLAQTALSEYNVTEELSSTRLSAVLDLPEVAYPALTRDIETGTQTLGGAAAYTVAEGTNVKAYIDQIQAAEQGRIFMSLTCSKSTATAGTSSAGEKTFNNMLLLA